jgi:hypothetical protein
MAHTACRVCFISRVNGRSRKRKNALEDVALVAGTQQNLSNLLFFRYLWLNHIFDFVCIISIWRYKLARLAMKTFLNSQFFKDIFHL